MSNAAHVWRRSWKRQDVEAVHAQRPELARPQTAVRRKVDCDSVALVDRVGERVHLLIAHEPGRCVPVRAGAGGFALPPAAAWVDEQPHRVEESTTARVLLGRT